jgi:HEAT repeat protein
VSPLRNDAYLVRVEAAKVLAELGDRRVVPRLVLVLDDHDPVVRIQIARSLEALGDRRALSYLSARLSMEDSAEVRAAIKGAIARISGIPFPQ